MRPAIEMNIIYVVYQMKGSRNKYGYYLKTSFSPMHLDSDIMVIDHKTKCKLVTYVTINVNFFFPTHLDNRIRVIYRKTNCKLVTYVKINVNFKLKQQNIRDCTYV